MMSITKKHKIFIVLLSAILLQVCFALIFSLVGSVQADTFSISSKNGGTIEVVSSGALMFSDDNDYKFDNPTANIVGANYIKTTKAGDTLTVTGSGWVHVLTSSYTHASSKVISQKTNLINDGFYEEDFIFSSTLSTYHGHTSAGGSYAQNIAIFAPFGIFTKQVGDGAKININDFAVVIYSKEKIDFDTAITPTDSKELKEIAVGEKIFFDSTEVFSNLLPTELQGLKYVYGSKTVNSALKATRSGYVYAFSKSTALTGFIDYGYSVELIDGDAPYNLFIKFVKWDDSLSLAGGIIAFTTNEYIPLNNSIIEENLAVVDMSENSAETSIAVVENGSKFMNDRDFIFATLPSYLKGLNYSKGFMNSADTNKVIVKTKTSGYVYALANDTEKPNLIAQGFTKKYEAPLAYVNSNLENLYLYEINSEVDKEYSISNKWGIFIFSNTPSAGDVLGEGMAKNSLGNDMLRLEFNENSRIFRNRHFFIGDKIPLYLQDKSFLQTDSDKDTNVTITKAGIVYVGVATSQTAPAGFILQNYPEFKVSFSNVLSGMKLYAKYCNVGEKITFQRNTLPIFDKLDSYDLSPAMTPAVITNLALEENTSLRQDHYTDDRDFQGCATVATTQGGRTFYGLFTGGVHEPEMENYGIVMVADETGKKLVYDPLLVIDHTIKGPHGVRVEDVQLWMQPGTNNLWVFWTNSGCIEDWTDTFKNFDMSLGVWASVITNPDAPLDELVWTTPKKVADGLMRNKPTVLESGELLVCSYDVVNTAWAKVYIYPNINNLHEWFNDDSAQMFEEKGRVYAPENSMFDEHQIVELSNGTLWMLMRANQGISQSYSYDGGVHWSKAELNRTLLGGNSRFYLERLTDNNGDYNGEILFVNHMNPSGSVSRSHLTAMILNEQGDILYSLLLDERNFISYPDVQIQENGEIWVAYDHGRSAEMELLLAVFTVDDIKAGAFNSANSTQKHILSKSYKNSPVEIAKNGISDGSEDVVMVVNLNTREFVSLYTDDGNGNLAEVNGSWFLYQNNILTIYKDFFDTIENGNVNFVIKAKRYDNSTEDITFVINKISISEENINLNFVSTDKDSLVYQTNNQAKADEIFTYVKESGRDVLKIKNTTTSDWTHDSFAIKNNYFGDVVVETVIKNDTKDTAKTGFPVLFLRKADVLATHENSGGGIGFAVIKGDSSYYLIVYDSYSSDITTKVSIANGLYKVNEYNKYKVIAEGNSFAFYINGQYIITYRHEKGIVPSVGAIGIASSSASVYVDSLSVKQFDDKILKVSDSTLFYDFKDLEQLNDFYAYYQESPSSSVVRATSVTDVWNVDTTLGRLTAKKAINDSSNSNISSKDYHVTSLFPVDIFLSNFDMSVDYKRNTTGNNSNWLALVGRQRTLGNYSMTNGLTAFVQKEGIATMKSTNSGGFKTGNTYPSYVDTDWHNLRIVYVGFNCSIYIDNELCLTYRATDHEALAGFLGLQSRNNYGAFSNLSITALDQDGNPVAIGDKNNRVKVATIGDSITYGAGAYNDQNEFEIEQNYPSQLARMLGSNFDLRNYGHSGRTITTGNESILSSYEYKYALQYAPDVLFVMLGTNDVKDSYWNSMSIDAYKQKFITDYTTLINAFKTANPSVDIYVMLSPPLYLEESSAMPPSRILNYIIEWQKEIAQNTSSNIIDIYSVTTDMAENFPDKIHPNVSGYGIIANTVYNAFTTNNVTDVVVKNIVSSLVSDETLQLNVEVKGKYLDLYDAKPMFESSNTSVLGVDSNGLISAKKPGNSVLKVKVGLDFYEYNITVLKKSLTINPTILEDDYIYGDKMPLIFANSNMGTIAFDSGQKLLAGEKEYLWTFTPFNTEFYEVVNGSISIKVAKAGSDIIKEIPILNAVEYKDGLKLSDITLPSGYSWKNSDTIITKSGHYDAIYTPADSENYESVELKIAVIVEAKEDDKTPIIPNVIAPTLNVIEYRDGLKLSDITLPSGYSWKNSNTIITKSGHYDAIYTPTDSENYESVELKIAVIVSATQEIEPISNNSSTGKTVAIVVVSIVSVLLAAALVVTIIKYKNKRV